jgi:multimeric flavodoxin WrbA
MGSPRRHSSTEILLDRVLLGAEQMVAEVDKVVVSEIKVHPCMEIYACRREGKCAIKDDMEWLYVKLLEADHIVFSSPIFFYGLTSQAKAIVDRCQALWVRKYTLGMETGDKRVRRGVFVSVGATRGEKLFDGAVLTVKYFFNAIGVKYAGDLLIKGIEHEAQIREHATAFQDAFRLGQRLVCPDII